MSAYQFGPADAEVLAAALGKETGHRLMTDWVEISESGWAGERIITVVEEDVMAKVRPYVDDPSWASIHDPMLFGTRLNGEQLFVPLTQHDQYIGMTESGKSSAIQNMIAYVTRCANARIWVGGVGKMYDLVGEWHERYMGTEFPVPIDWVATGPQDTLEMMAAAMRVAHYRQTVPVAMQQDWPVLIVILDEVTDIAEDDEHTVMYEGRRMFGTDMLAKFARRTASGKVYGKFATQRGTNDMFGDKGGTTTAMLLLTAAFMTQDSGDLGRLMNDNYKLSMPRHKGQCWLKLGGDLPVQVKVPYLQPASRGKKRLHDGITIPEVAWSRRLTRSSLDEGSIAAAGESYARRFTHMTPEFQNYLRGIGGDGGVPTLNTPAPRPTPTPLNGSPQDETPDADEAMAEALALARSLGVELPDGLVSERDETLTTPSQPQGSDAAAPVVTSASTQYKTRADKVYAVVVTNDINGGDPLPRGAIVQELRSAFGDEVRNERVVSNILNDLVNAEQPRLARTEDGRYYSL